MNNIKALAKIIKAFGDVHFRTNPSVSVASLADTAMHSPLTAFIQVTSAMQPVFEYGFTNGLEEAYDSIKADMLTNTPLTKEQKNEFFEVLYTMPTGKKHKKK